jgi:tetratricopeptide (TPR) repeat protein
MAQQRAVDAEGEKLLAEALRLSRDTDTFAAVEMLARQDDATRVAGVYEQAVLDLYWKEKDVPRLVAFGRAGMQYGLTAAVAAERAGEAERAAALRWSAKRCAYNVASFVWPGWDEPGVAVTRADVVVGLDAAKLNLRLARELEKGDPALSRAHWLVGAMQLASGHRQEALASFREAVRHADLASTQALSDAALARAYVALTERLRAAQDSAAFDAARAALAKVEEGDFFVGQIDTAWRVFGPGGKWAEASGDGGARPGQ